MEEQSRITEKAISGTEETAKQLSEMQKIIVREIRFLTNINPTIKRLLSEGYTIEQILEKYKQD